jgi:hypothetical protein
MALTRLDRSRIRQQCAKLEAVELDRVVLTFILPPAAEGIGCALDFRSAQIKEDRDGRPP